MEKRKRHIQLSQRARQLSTISEQVGHPLHGTTFGTSNPTNEVSLYNGARNSKYFPNLFDCKKTPYSVWRDRSCHYPFPDIGIICDSTVQGTGQEPNHRRCSNRFYQQARGVSVSRKGKQC